jgi:hypothetical protein
MNPFPLLITMNPPQQNQPSSQYAASPADTVLNLPELILNILTGAPLATCLASLVNRRTAAVWADHHYYLLSRAELNYRRSYLPPCETFTELGRIGDLWEYVRSVTNTRNGYGKHLHYLTAGVVSVTKPIDLSEPLQIRKVDPWRRIEVTIYVNRCIINFHRDCRNDIMSQSLGWRVIYYSITGLRCIDYRDRDSYNYYITPPPREYNPILSCYHHISDMLAEYMVSDSVEFPSATAEALGFDLSCVSQQIVIDEHHTHE